MGGDCAYIQRLTPLWNAGQADKRMTDQGESAVNATQGFLGEPEDWTHVRVELHDVHGLWGGRACYVWGTGQVVARVAPVPQSEERYVHTLPPGDIVRLVMALIETDFVTLTFPERLGLPDEARPTIVVCNSAGAVRRVSKWANEAHAGFQQVYALLCGFVAQAQQGERIYQGPFEQQFTPPLI